MKVKNKFVKTMSNLKCEANKTVNDVKHELHFISDTEHARANLQEDLRSQLNNFKIDCRDFFAEVENNIINFIDKLPCLGDSTHNSGFDLT